MIILALTLMGAVECATILERVDLAPKQGAGAVEAFDDVVELLGRDAAQVTTRARSLIGADGDYSLAFAVVKAALVESCGSFSKIDADEARATVTELLKDPRFHGMREGDDVVDRILHKIWLWALGLVESEAMQKFSLSSTRIYLAGFAIAVALVIFWRVVRVLRLRGEDEDTEVTRATRIERERQRAFAELRKEADDMLRAGNARGALLAGQRAILARIGELDRTAVTPARTHREILAETRFADVLRPALSYFDLAFFGRNATVDDAAAFLDAVDRAVSAMQAGSPAQLSPNASRGDA